MMLLRKYWKFISVIAVTLSVLKISTDSRLESR